jgi:type VI secretion system secreted protein VgrG
MKLSDNGIRTLKQCEGRVMHNGRHVIYDDKNGRPIAAGAALPAGATIGYGHLIKPGEDFRNGIDEDTATEILRDDLKHAERAVCNAITTNLRQNQFDALVMLCFNIGARNFANSTVVKYINNPNFKSSIYPTIAAAWRAWNKTGGRVSAGLLRRREIELNIYQNGIYALNL